jgi:hypothetical protein
LNENDPAASRVAALLQERGPDPVPDQPEGLGVPGEQWTDAWIAVLTFALSVTGSNAHADDIRQESYTRMLKTRPWRPEDQPSFVKHMLLVARSVLKHNQKAHARRTHHEANAGAEYRRDRGDTASPEDDALDHAEALRRQDHGARVLAEVKRKLAGYPLELRLIDYIAQRQDQDDDELEKPAQIAQALGVRVEEIYRACARIKRYRASVYAAVGGPGEEKQ